MSHIQHSFILPFIIPVDGAAVYKGRVHTTALAEFSARWTHGEHHMEVLPDPVDEELVHRLLGVWNVRLRGGLFEVHPDSIPLLRVKQVRDLTRVQDTIDVFQEGFLKKSIRKFLALEMDDKIWFSRYLNHASMSYDMIWQMSFTSKYL